MSQITTHILDTTKGRPVANVGVALYRGENTDRLAVSKTNADGRVPGLLPPGQLLPPGVYKLQFLTADYFEKEGGAYFYPIVDIWFKVNDESHYHVPLLLNPFGYSTYRGS